MWFDYCLVLFFYFLKIERRGNSIDNPLAYFMQLHFEKAMAQSEVNFCKDWACPTLKLLKRIGISYPPVHVFYYWLCLTPHPEGGFFFFKKNEQIQSLRNQKT